MDIIFKDILCKLNNSSNLSSHDAVVGELSLQSVNVTMNEVDHSNKYTEFIASKPKWNEAGIAGYQAETYQSIKELVTKLDQPSQISVHSEMCSEMLVKSAEKYFDTQKSKKNSKSPKSSKSPKFSKFSPEHIAAYSKHEKICKEWRLAGRPSDHYHPAKIAKVNSQRNLQSIARESESCKAIQLHNELMETHRKDISKVCQKLKQIRGDKYRNIDIPYIETLCGTYSGKNVLEGFTANTEILCNKKPNLHQYDENFYNI